jgi:hypothetical protein
MVKQALQMGGESGDAAREIDVSAGGGGRCSKNAQAGIRFLHTLFNRAGGLDLSRTHAFPLPHRPASHLAAGG